MSTGTTDAATPADVPTKKKTTKKKATPKSAKAKAPKTKASNGLTTNQVKVLKALKGTTAGSKELTRAQLSEKTGITKGWAKLLGAGTHEGYGVGGEASMAGMGLIRIAQYEGSRTLAHSITAKGLKALEAVK